MESAENNNWSNLRCSVEKPDIINHYGEERMPMQLRMLSEAIYGRGPAGQDGAGVRRMMMSMENNVGGQEAMYMSMLSIQ